MKSFVKIPLKNGVLLGDLLIPEDAKGIVLFAHGSGSSRLSPRNQFVAKFLYEKQIATLLIDLLTEQEEKIDDITGELRFNIGMLADRLLVVTEYILQDKKTKHLPIAYFGASTGAAAALIAAAKQDKRITSVVSRGGRPDLAEPYLTKVKAPILLIVGGADPVVLDLNQDAFNKIPSRKKLEIIPHATHLFEEKGALEKVAELSAKWFSGFFC